MQTSRVNPSKNHQPIVVYCDFDGTITQSDTVDFLLNRLADPQWLEIEARWEKGEIGSRECMGAQIPLIQGGWPAIETALADVKVDPTFGRFALWCKWHKIPLVIVSEGMDRVIQTLFQREKIEVDSVWANHLSEAEDGTLSLGFPNASPDPACRSGLCKCRVLSNEIPALPEAPPEPQTLRVVIGDGMSDRCWAAEADLLFAKSKLKTYCEKNDIPHLPFEDFDQVYAVLNQLRKTPESLPEPVLNKSGTS